MMIDDPADPILENVSALAVLAADAERAERVRARCRARLARRAQDHEQRFGPALVAGFSVVYLSAVVHDVLKLRGIL